MIRINQLKLSPNHSENDLLSAIKNTLKLKTDHKFDFKIIKRSVDSRHKPEILYIYSVNINFHNLDFEKQVVKRVNNNNIMLTEVKGYEFPFQNMAITKGKRRPVIIGFGPAGMFCGLFLARAGLRPIIIERGQAVDDRIKTVDELWNHNILNANSNVQFGEGGAGTFSDGKLNSMVKDPSGKITKVLETFVEAGADSSILYLNKPHIGTDVLRDVVKNIRNEIINLGGEVKFNCCLERIHVIQNQVESITVATGNTSDKYYEDIQCNQLVMAIGHSARDTFQMLLDSNVEMVGKAFAVGLRIEHPQEFINYNAYGKTEYVNLPVADYKITYQAKSGRGIYSFCMCPGGFVVNASSEAERIAVNGMSYSKRDSQNANSALIVTVTPQDFDGVGPLAGVEFQRKLEHAAYVEGKGSIPVQLTADFKLNRKTTGLGKISPCIKGTYELANLRNVLPEYISTTMIEGLQNFNHLIPGYDMEEAVFSGIESRTSSPVRILRDDNGESNVGGLFPCGEGAGYAGGITSAAIDGLKVAEKIAQKYIN